MLDCVTFGGTGLFVFSFPLLEGMDEISKEKLMTLKTSFEKYRNLVFSSWSSRPHRYAFDTFRWHLPKI